MRFRRRIRIFPGVYLNLNKNGWSLTFGRGGMSINTGRKGTYINTGIPGTGIYDRQKLSGEKQNNQEIKNKEVIAIIDERDEAFIEIIKLFQQNKSLTLEDVKEKLFLGTNRARRQLSKAIERGFVNGSIDASMTLKRSEEIKGLLKEFGIYETE